MAVTSTELSCRLGTVRLPQSFGLEPAELARMVELELGQLLRWAPPLSRRHVVVRSPRLVLRAPAWSPPAGLARLIALEIYQLIHRGAMS